MKGIILANAGASAFNFALYAAWGSALSLFAALFSLAFTAVLIGLGWWS